MAKFLGAVRFTDGNLMWFIWNGTIDLARPKLFASPEAASDAWDDPQTDMFENRYRPGGELVDVMPLYGLDNPAVYFQSRANRERMLLIGPLCFDQALEEERHGERDQSNPLTGQSNTTTPTN
ncbi:hypothetical protein BLA13014_04615 [Burkholderia aenigmatica]|uniref:Uncharacterized protein n=1 Tax=Burkholderia aenigmatica TaxID=2015348 RepID=A0A6P2NUB6_9BURK|nr:hypothetical protein [Burkholderia aenigmatica]VWB98652.1 hypothetical protein BLA13014_04615 [Burkholderia aenigmatica]